MLKSYRKYFFIPDIRTINEYPPQVIGVREMGDNECHIRKPKCLFLPQSVTTLFAEVNHGAKTPELRQESLYTIWKEIGKIFT